MGEAARAPRAMPGEGDEGARAGDGEERQARRDGGVDGKRVGVRTIARSSERRRLAIAGLTPPAGARMPRPLSSSWLRRALSACTRRIKIKSERLGQ